MSVLLDKIQETKQAAPNKKDSGGLKYRNVRGKKLILADGTIMKPNKDDGLFYPKTEEELVMCGYFASLGHLALVE